MNQLHLHRVNAGICEVTTSDGLHVGNLKLIGGLWKFKAIGYDRTGRLVPGGGPFTHRHDTILRTLDGAELKILLD